MRIKKELLENILELSKEAYPNEVAAILLNNPVDDFVIMPAEFTTYQVHVKMNLIPIYVNLHGTFHSHPTSNNNPSRADLSFFGKLGKEHLIIAYPYDLNAVAVYKNNGEKTELEILWTINKVLRAIENMQWNKVSLICRLIKD